MKKIINAEVYEEDCEFKDKGSGEVKEYKRYWADFGNGIKVRIVPNKDQFSIVKQIGYKTEEVKER